MEKTFIIVIILCIVFILLFLFLFNHSLKQKAIRYENFDNNKIPKIIVQTWKTKNIPKKYVNDIASLKKVNPEFQFLFFNDDDIEYFLKTNYPEYYKSYLKLPVKIQKIDYFRYIAIYHYGGFYFDLDMTGIMPLDDLLDYECVFPVDQNIKKAGCGKKRLKNFCEKNMAFLLGQYAFGAKPENDFIKKLIDNIHNNIDIYVQLYTNTKDLLYVYSTTGPDYVTNVYLDYDKKDSIHILKHSNDQYFGHYAKHNHYGTWK
jgi:mannosyltransferase OCH1-like enzyme